MQHSDLSGNLWNSCQAISRTQRPMRNLGVVLHSCWVWAQSRFQRLHLICQIQQIQILFSQSVEQTQGLQFWERLTSKMRAPYLIDIEIFISNKRGKDDLNYNAYLLCNNNTYTSVAIMHVCIYGYQRISPMFYLMFCFYYAFGG